jgi:integrase
MRPRRERPIPRINPSGKRVWIARWTDRSGRRHKAGTFEFKGPCRNPAEGSWSGSRWVGCCAQHAIDAAYDRHYGPAAAESVTVGAYKRTWLKRHPRTERTNKNYAGRVDGQLDVELEGVKFRDWPMDEIRRRHATDLLDNMLREQKRAAKGAQGILRVLSAMWQNAIEDDRAEFNPFMGVRVRQDDPRVEKSPRRIRVWSWQEMHSFAGAAGKWEPMVRVISDCWLRIGEVFPLERGDLMRGACPDGEFHGVECRVDGPHLHVVKTSWRGKVTVGTKGDRLRAAHGGSPWQVGRAVPVTDDLLELLDGMPARIDTPLLFPGPRGIWTDRYWYDEVWYPARKAAGIDATPHEFRHSAISHLRAAGIDPADLAAMSGHTVETATKHYTHALGRSFDAARKTIGGSG